MDSTSNRAALLTAALAATTTGGAVLALSTASVWWGVGAAAIATLVGVVQFLLLQQRIHSFKSEKDPRFLKFFKNWYAQDGTHFVFCRDLDWISTPEAAVILASITARADRFEFFVSEDDAAACKTIRDHGGSIYRIPVAVAQINVKLSLHVDHEDKRIIFRKKLGERVRFAEESDANVVALAETLIQACRSIAQADPDSATNG